MKLRMKSAVAAAAAFSLTGGLVAAPLVLAPTPAHAQQKSTVGTLLAGLLNVAVNIPVAVGDVDVIDDVTINDVNILSIESVDVSNVLNNNQIDILRNAIQNNPIASNNQDVLNDLLREANIITDNQVVVGILGGTVFVL